MKGMMLAFLLLAGSHSASGAVRADEWVSSVDIVRAFPPYTEDPRASNGAGTVFDQRHAWISVADMPADLRKRPFKGNTIVAAATDEIGRITACRVLTSSGDARLDQIACRKLQKSAVFPLFHKSPGKPFQHLNVSIFWETTSRIDMESRRPIRVPMPRPIDYEAMPGSHGWPRTVWDGEIGIDRFPDLQSEYNRLGGKRGVGETSVELVVDPDGTIDCGIGVGSGDAALDTRACEIGRALPLSYTNACDVCERQRLPLKFVWRREGSYIVAPIAMADFGTLFHQIARDPAEPRSPHMSPFSSGHPTILSGSISQADFADIPDRATATAPVEFRIGFDLTGATSSCVVTASSGNGTVDARVCALAAKVRWTVPADVFGVALTSFALKFRLKLQGSPDATRPAR